jgi:hypothetical protein
MRPKASIRASVSGSSNADRESVLRSHDALTELGHHAPEG